MTTETKTLPYADDPNYAVGCTLRTVKLFDNLANGAVVADSLMSLRNPNIIEVRDVPEEIADAEVAARMRNTIMLDKDGRKLRFDQLNDGKNLRRLASSQWPWKSADGVDFVD